MEENLKNSQKFEENLGKKIEELGVYCFDQALLDEVGNYISETERNNLSKYKKVEEKYINENLELKLNTMKVAKRRMVNFFYSYFFFRI